MSEFAAAVGVDAVVAARVVTRQTDTVTGFSEARLWLERARFDIRAIKVAARQWQDTQLSSEKGRAMLAS